MAPSSQDHQEPLQPWCEGRWDDVQLMAHADICPEILSTEAVGWNRGGRGSPGGCLLQVSVVPD